MTEDRGLSEIQWYLHLFIKWIHEVEKKETDSSEGCQQFDKGWGSSMVKTETQQLKADRLANDTERKVERSARLEWRRARDRQTRKKAEESTKRGRATETQWHARQAGSLPQSSLQHHNTTSNCKTHGPALAAQWAIIGLRCTTYTQKSTFSTLIQRGSNFKTNNTTCVFFDSNYFIWW